MAAIISHPIVTFTSTPTPKELESRLERDFPFAPGTKEKTVVYSIPGAKFHVTVKPVSIEKKVVFFISQGGSPHESHERCGVTQECLALCDREVQDFTLQGREGSYELRDGSVPANLVTRVNAFVKGLAQFSYSTGMCFPTDMDKTVAIWIDGKILAPETVFKGKFSYRIPEEVQG